MKPDPYRLTRQFTHPNTGYLILLFLFILVALLYLP